jgi:hypothetical protein
LFILTCRYRAFILSYKPSSGDIITRAYGDVQVRTFFIMSNEIISVPPQNMVKSEYVGGQYIFTDQ